METISLKMEKSLLDEMDSKLKENRYSTRTEFIRDSVRRRLSELEKEEAIRKLEENFGKFKGKFKHTDEEAGNLAVKKLLKRFNMDLE